jgi:hypothetical protein
MVIATPDAPSKSSLRHQAAHHGRVQLSGSCQQFKILESCLREIAQALTQPTAASAK